MCGSDAVVLACATIAGAQQPPVVRVRREQQLVLARVPAGSEPELRVAPGITTVVRFDAEVVHVGLSHAQKHLLHMGPQNCDSFRRSRAHSRPRWGCRPSRCCKMDRMVAHPKRPVFHCC